MAAITENNYVQGGSSQTVFSFTFPYFKQTEVKVSVNAEVKTAGSDYTLPSATTIQFNSAPAQNDKIKIYRETDTTTLPATFYAGSAIKSEDLNDNFLQNLYSNQETQARSLSALGDTMTGNLTMGEDTVIVFEGATDDDYETTLTVTDPTADRTITLPNVTGTVVTTGDTGTVTSTMIADATIVNSDIANTTITGGKLVNDTITAAQISANAVTASELADDAVDTNAILDDNVTYAKIQNVTATDRVLGRDSAGAGIIEEIAPAALRTMINVEDGATADQTNAEIRTAVEAATDSNVFTDADHSKLNAIEAGATADQTSTEIKALLASDNLDASHLAADSVGTSEIADAELVTLAGMQSGTASILAGGTALAATLTEINTICDGKGVETTITDDDTKYPTSGAVVDYVAAQIAPIGGLEVIADDESFPNTIPAAGVVISISDAAGLQINSSGVSTNGDTLDNSTVTINGFPSELRGGVSGNADPYVLAAGTGLMVQSTGSSQTYNYHQVMIREADFVQLSDDINDFNSRYRTAGSRTADGDASNNDGDLFYDQGTNKMYVHDGSAWSEVTSVGDYKLLTIEDTDGSAFDGANQSFNLKDGSSAASVTSAGQLIVSVNGVIQKPNAGTSAPAEGFAMVDGDTIIFSNAPGAGASVFVTLIGSATTINTPGSNSVAEATIQSNVVSEEKLKISNAPTNTHVLTADATVSGGMKWAATANASPTTTRGDVIYRGASADERLAKGTAGQYLKIGANDPEWADVVGAVADGCIFENDLIISNDYTIASTKGAHSVGPITVNATVTVNGNWVVS